MKRTLGMVSKFILIFFLSDVKHKRFIFPPKNIRERVKCEDEMRSVGPYLALSVFIWHYYSLGNKFWHAKISDNSNIKFNQ